MNLSDVHTYTINSLIIWFILKSTLKLVKLNLTSVTVQKVQLMIFFQTVLNILFCFPFTLSCKITPAFFILSGGEASWSSCLSREKY